MTSFFRTILYTPLLNALIFLSNFLPQHDLGLSIILLTVIIRLLFLPLSIKSQRSQRAMNLINPQIEAIKQKHKNDQAAQGQAMMKLYKENGINPIAGCVPLLIQLPILIALYRAFIAGLNPQNFILLYPFVHNPGVINTMFLGFINIAVHNRILAVLAGVLQFFQARQSLSYMKTSGGGNQQLAALNSQMMYVFPIMILIIGWNLPAGLVLYWITTTVFSMGEQLYLRRNK